jgi:hypothetical protein
LNACGCRDGGSGALAFGTTARESLELRRSSAAIDDLLGALGLREERFAQ